MNKHPNATAATGSGAAGVFVAWLLGHVGIDISAETGAAIATAAAATVLFIGHRGIRGAARSIWRGSDGNAQD